MKKHQETLTEEVFIYDAIVYGNPTIYKIKDQDNEPIKETFYEQELQLLVEPNTCRIKKGIQKKKRRAIVYCYMQSGKVIQINSIATCFKTK